MNKKLVLFGCAVCLISSLLGFYNSGWKFLLSWLLMTIGGIYFGRSIVQLIEKKRNEKLMFNFFEGVKEGPTVTYTNLK